MNFARRSPIARTLSIVFSILTILLISGTGHAARVEIFDSVKDHSDPEYLSVSLSPTAYGTLEQRAETVNISFPTAVDQTYDLEMTRFDVLLPDAQFREGMQEGIKPNVILLRGSAAGEDNSTAFIALDPSGTANGYLTVDGETWYLARPIGSDELTIQQSHGAELPPFVEFCGVQDGQAPKLEGLDMSAGLTDSPAGVRVAEIAIEGDEEYVALFGSTLDAINYATTLIGAISEIYVRDMNVKLTISFMRMWPGGGEPFSSYDVADLRSYWINNEDTTGLNVVHLLSGHRDLPFGGIAFVSGTCHGYGYSIGGFINGSFPTPVGPPNNGDWDIVVSAHEMGHNFGTGHTHDIAWYDPTIDDCGTTTPSRGTIMSYCHIWPGYTSNTDLRFHTRVQATIEYYVTFNDCYWFDCNGNMIADSVDIANLTSDDVNANGIPDECEDCNSNGILDDADIAGGAPDINNNGIPDECEPDCDADGTLDVYEVDGNGDNIPDECDPDCNSNGTPDWADIYNGADDFDRNVIPDECQDCNSNGKSDWLDIDHQFNLFVADRSLRVREFHAASGVPTYEYGGFSVSSAWDVTFGPDGHLYTASMGNQKIIRTVLSTSVSTDFYDGSGISMSPTGVKFGNNGYLYVTDATNDRVIKLDGTTGAFVEYFVSAGLGGLNSPYALTFGPNGNLFVASEGTNEIIEYSGTDGSLVGVFVSAGSGGLDSPRGLVFKPDGNLLVTSYFTDNVLEYNGTTGAFVGVFNDLNPPDRPWGIAIGPNGNVFVARTADNAYQVLEYVIDVGRYFRSFVRRDLDLVAPGGIAFAPESPNDCNGNLIPDDCDIATGVLHDANSNGIPDECDTGDQDGDGIPDESDNCPNVYNSNQDDSDDDGIGDACDECTDLDDDGYGDPGFPANTCQVDNCPDIANPDQADADGDGIGDACDECTDTDDDGYGDPGFPNNTCPEDNCPDTYNPDQQDPDGDGIGYHCDECSDIDGDGYAESVSAWTTCPQDNCISVANPDQADTDGDGIGDACDDCIDSDNDGFGDPGYPNNTCPEDNCPNVANPDQADANLDNIGDACCCLNIRGNTNSDPEDKVNISDVTYLTDYLFGIPNGPIPGCPAEGNVNGNTEETINIADVTYLIAFLFDQPGGPPPPACP